MASRRTSLAGGLGRVLPKVEALEDRCCPTTLSLQGHTLLINGGPTSDVVTVRDDGVGDVSASVHAGGVTKTINAHGVQKIVVNSGNGDDSVNYQLTGALKTSRELDVNLGSGSDLVSLNFLRGVSAPKLKVDLEGGKGADEATVLLGAVKNTHVDFTANLGAGTDHLFALLDGNLSGSANVLFKARGGAAYDGIVVEALGNIGAQASLSVNANGGAGDDTVHVDYQGQLNGRLDVLADGGSGSDLVAADVTLKAGSKGVLQAKVEGGTGDDLLVMRIHDLSHKLKSLKAQLDGGGGNDVGLVSGPVKVTRTAVN